MSWIVVSLVLSVLLTLILNVAVRALPNSRQRLEERTDRWLEAPTAYESPRVRVFFPWKAMLIGSVALTVLLNLFAALARP